MDLWMRDLAPELLGETRASTEISKKGEEAYPALYFRVQIDDRRGCLSSAIAERVQQEMARFLSPVARPANANADLQVIVTDVSCPRIDIPQQSLQAVNSTYVAGRTQLVNPRYVQLQSVLASAEANLSRARCRISG
jgi:regulator of protease activity HflC (stomatin/prohibitin superfamily)